MKLRKAINRLRLILGALNNIVAIFISGRHCWQYFLSTYLNEVENTYRTPIITITKPRPKLIPLIHKIFLDVQGVIFLRNS